MGKRHDDALMIQGGACNGIGIAHSLVEAYREAMDETSGTDQMNRDPAVQLILHQLCHLALIWTKDHSPESGGFNWDKAYQHCIDHASDRTLELLKLSDRKTRPPESPMRVTGGLNIADAATTL